MTSIALKGPTPGSQTYIALKKLHQVGGRADQMAWINVSGWARPVASFNTEVIGRLTARSMIFLRDGLFHITDTGLAHIGVEPGAAPIPPAVVAGPRYVPPMRELDDRYKVRLYLTRPGALDYIGIPSRHGDTRLEHKTIAVAGDVQG